MGLYLRWLRPLGFITFAGGACPTRALLSLDWSPAGNRPVSGWLSLGWRTLERFALGRLDPPERLDEFNNFNCVTPSMSQPARGNIGTLGPGCCSPGADLRRHALEGAQAGGSVSQPTITDSSHRKQL